MSDPLLVRHVAKRFGRVTALHDISLTVARGEITALVGPNGAGKSTLLKLCVGLVRPDAGEICLGGSNVQRHPGMARQAVGFVPQRVQFHDDSAIRDVVRHYAALRGLDPEAGNRALEQVGLGGVTDRPARALSGGMMQRAGLAIALLGNPALLLLDEPMVSLDPGGSAAVREVLTAHRARGGGVLIATHVLHDAERLADRVCLLLDGRVFADAPIPELVRRFAPDHRSRDAAVGPLEAVYHAVTTAQAAA